MNKIILAVIIYMFFMGTFSQAAETYGDFHFIKYIKSTSVNTFLADIPGSHPLVGRKIEIVLKGIAVPRLMAGCRKERDTARRGMELVSFLLERSKNITLHNVERGRRFRLVATVLADGKDIRQVLIAKGLAFNNVSRNKVKDWCQ